MGSQVEWDTLLFSLPVVLLCGHAVEYYHEKTGFQKELLVYGMHVAHDGKSNNSLQRTGYCSIGVTQTQ